MIIATLIVIVGNLPVIVFELHSDMKDFESRNKSSLDLIHDFSSLGVLGFAIETQNKMLIEKSVQSILNQEFVSKVNVLDMDGNLVFESAKADFSMPSADKIIDIPIMKLSTFESNDALFNDLVETEKTEMTAKAGKLTIYTTKKLYQEAQLSRFSKYIGILIGVLLIMALIFYFVTKKITRSVIKMLQSARKLADGETGIIVSNDLPVKEFEEFSKSFNEVSKKLDIHREAISNEMNSAHEKSSILQIAAHELKTPIAHIKSRLNIAIEFSDTKEAKKQIRNCLDNVYEINRHITSVLNMTAIDRGNYKPNVKWVNASSLIKRVIEPFESKIYSKPDLKLINRGVSALEGYEIFIDFDIVSVIIGNSIENGIKYTDEGFVRINTEIDEEKELFLVTITDTGIGLNDKELHLLRTSPRKLEPNIISRKRDGWGIGMQTMQKFSDILGASFHIDSNIGLGTKLSFGFPVSFRKVVTHSTTPEPFQPERIQSIFQTKNSQDHESSVRVLIIDNDKEYLELISEQFSPKIIKRNDVEVCFTNDVPLALAKMEDMYFDLILIDYHMEKDGLYVLRHIDQNENLCKNSIKHIITVDSQIDEETTTEMLKLSNGILSKGISTSDIRELLKKAILNAV